MPDLKTALSEALSRQLNDWENHEQQIRTSKTEPQQENEVKATAQSPTTARVSNNVMRSTFDYIKANPAKTRKDVLEALTSQGFKESSVGAVISQLMSSKQVHKNFDGGLHARSTEYKPIKQKPRASKVQIKQELKEKIQERRKIVVMKRKKSEPASDGIAALKTSTSVGELLREKLDPTLWKPESVVNNLNVVQARQLYDYLKNLFGG